MVRIWGRVMREDRIEKDTILEEGGAFLEENFFDYISSICERLGIATPVILTKHINHFETFHNAIFLPIDFPEDVDFDKFIIEDASNY